MVGSLEFALSRISIRPYEGGFGFRWTAVAVGGRPGVIALPLCCFIITLEELGEELSRGDVSMAGGAAKSFFSSAPASTYQRTRTLASALWKVLLGLRE